MKAGFLTMNNQSRDTTEAAFYAWLSADSPAKQDAHFARFYTGFSRVLEGSIRKRFRGMEQHVIDDAIAETMLIMLEKFGEPRRTAFVAVPEVLARLQPLDLGPLHTRRVGRWKTRLAQYRLNVLAYAPTVASSNADRKRQIATLSEEHRSLQNDGHSCVNDLRATVETTQHPPKELQWAIKRFITKLHQRLASEPAQTIDQAWGVAGASGFVLSMDELLTALPRLQVLSLAYVFVVCMNELNAFFRGGLKESGRPASRTNGDRAEHEPDEKEDAEGEPQTVADPAFEHWEGRGSWIADEAYGEVETLADPSASPEDQFAQQQLFQHLKDALEAPIQVAKDALAQTQTKKDRDRAQTKLDRALREHELDCALLIGWIDDESQEAQAEQLCLTRNQIRTGRERLGKHILAYCETHGIAYGDDIRALANGQSKRSQTTSKTTASNDTDQT